jgi:hypothetical protein
MIICPSCRHENVDGTQFCEMCGEELPDSTSTSAQTNVDLVKCPNCGFLNPSDNLACEACSAVLNPASTPATATVPATVPAAAVSLSKTPEPDPSFLQFGSSAPAEPDPATAGNATVGQVAPTSMAAPDLAPATPAATATPAAATALPAGNLAPGTLKLVVEQGQSVGAQFVLGDEEMLVGREDEEEDIYPDIDLSDQDAGYVHRRHATLNFNNGNLTVTHLGGSNKTRINNKPVADNVPTPVKPGDKIGFGKVVMRLLPI